MMGEGDQRKSGEHSGDFTLGEIVRLRCGGPEMVIHNFTEGGLVGVCWCDASDQFQHVGVAAHVLIRMSAKPEGDRMAVGE